MGRTARAFHWVALIYLTYCAARFADLRGGFALGALLAAFNLLRAERPPVPDERGLVWLAGNDKPWFQVSARTAAVLARHGLLSVWGVTLQVYHRWRMGEL